MIWHNVPKEVGAVPFGNPKNAHGWLAELRAQGMGSSVDQYREYFGKVQRVPWMMGETEMSNGAPYVVTLKKLMNPVTVRQFYAEKAK
jgi:hypothetical protein